MRRGIWVVMILFLAGFATLARADSLVLKNGDELSGRVVRVDNHVLYLATDYAGEILVSTTEIAGLKTARPVRVNFGGGDVAVGKIEVSPRKEVRLVTARVVRSLDIDRVDGITPLSLDEIKSAGFSRPMVWDHQAEIDAQIRAGNSSAQEVSVGYASEMTNDSVALDNELTMDLGWAKGARTTQQVFGQSRLDWSHTPQFYSFYSFNGQHDLLKSLYLRAREEAGVGYRVIKTKRTLLQGDIGLGLSEDVLKDVTDDVSPLGHLGAEFTQKVGKESECGIKATLLPDFSDPGEFLSDSEAWFVTPITRRFLLKLSVLNRFDSSPPPLIKKDDVTFKTGLVIVF